MIGRQRLNQNIPTLRYVECPACKKNRLLKPEEDGTVQAVSNETVDVRGEERFLDACEFCIIKYEKADQKFVKENLEKIKKAVSVNPDNATDHKDFSLDL